MGHAPSICECKCSEVKADAVGNYEEKDAAICIVESDNIAGKLTDSTRTPLTDADASYRSGRQWLPNQASPVIPKSERYFSVGVPPPDDNESEAPSSDSQSVIDPEARRLVGDESSLTSEWDIPGPGGRVPRLDEASECSQSACDSPGRNKRPKGRSTRLGMGSLASSEFSSPIILGAAGRRRSLTSVTAETTSESLQYIIENGGAIEDFYNFKTKILGKGTSGSVRMATLKTSGAKRAVKKIPKKENMDEKTQSALVREINLLKRIDHLYIVKLYETFEDHETIHLVMALSSHGHLAKYVASFPCKYLSEESAKSAMRDLVSAVNYLHRNFIMHRDIKPDNILIHRTVPLETRVTDFGIAREFPPNQVFTSRVGSPAFMAPEVFKRSYNQACDIWSCGITLYFLLCGYLPFDGKNIDDISEKVLTLPIEYATIEWVEATPSTLAFLELMLKKNPRARYTIDQAFHHEWLKPATKPPQVDMSKSVLDRLRTFRRGNKLKRSALIVVASMLKTSDVAQSHQIFKSLDTNGDGQISLSEMQDALKKTLRSDQDHGSQCVEVDKIFLEDQARAVEDDTKPFSYTEFIAATFDRKKCVTKRLARAVFGCYDKDGDGRISMAELAQGQLLGHLSMEEVAQTLEDLDSNRDCYVDFEEFMAMLQSTSMSGQPSERSIKGALSDRSESTSPKTVKAKRIAKSPVRSPRSQLQAEKAATPK